VLALSLPRDKVVTSRLTSTRAQVASHESKGRDGTPNDRREAEAEAGAGSGTYRRRGNGSWRLTVRDTDGNRLTKTVKASKTDEVLTWG